MVKNSTEYVCEEEPLPKWQAKKTGWWGVVEVFWESIYIYKIMI